MTEKTLKNLGVFIVGVIIGGGGTCLYLISPVSMPIRTKACKVLGLNQILRKLWSDHVFWTRQFIVSTLADLPDAPVAAQRLMKNQDDLGATIARYFGNKAGAQLTDLLKEHIAIAVELVQHAKAGNKIEFKITESKWHKNAEDLATFLHNADPNKSYAMLLNMLNEHLALTTQEIIKRVARDWKADVANFDTLYQQGLGMADSFTDIITEKFPERF